MCPDSGADLFLCLLPEFRLQQIFVMLHKNPAQLGRKAQKRSELFGKDIIVCHRKPWFGIQFIFILPGRGEFAKVAVGEPAQFIVIVKHNPAQAGDTEIFKQ